MCGVAVAPPAVLHPREGGPEVGAHDLDDAQLAGGRNRRHDGRDDGGRRCVVEVNATVAPPAAPPAAAPSCTVAGRAHRGATQRASPSDTKVAGATAASPPSAAAKRHSRSAAGAKPLPLSTSGGASPDSGAAAGATAATAGAAPPCHTKRPRAVGASARRPARLALDPHSEHVRRRRRRRGQRAAYLRCTHEGRGHAHLRLLRSAAPSAAATASPPVAAAAVPLHHSKDTRERSRRR